METVSSVAMQQQYHLSTTNNLTLNTPCTFLL